MESTGVRNILRKDSTGLSESLGVEDKGDKRIEADSKALNQYCWKTRDNFNGKREIGNRT